MKKQRPPAEWTPEGPLWVRVVVFVIGCGLFAAAVTATIWM